MPSAIAAAINAPIGRANASISRNTCTPTNAIRRVLLPQHNCYSQLCSVFLHSRGNTPTKWRKARTDSPSASVRALMNCRCTRLPPAKMLCTQADCMIPHHSMLVCLSIRHTIKVHMNWEKKKKSSQT